jgi:hypothetical protein
VQVLKPGRKTCPSVKETVIKFINFSCASTGAYRITVNDSIYCIIVIRWRNCGARRELAVAVDVVVPGVEVKVFREGQEQFAVALKLEDYFLLTRCG